LTDEGGKYTTSRNLASCEIRDIDAHVAEAKASYSDFPDHAVDYLARIYGTELSQVMEIARSDKLATGLRETNPSEVEGLLVGPPGFEPDPRGKSASNFR